MERIHTSNLIINISEDDEVSISLRSNELESYL